MNCRNAVFPTIQSAGANKLFFSAVMNWIQNLNRLMNSWGERETEQLSGLLAVHGWSVPCKGKTQLNHRVRSKEWAQLLCCN